MIRVFLFNCLFRFYRSLFIRLSGLHPRLHWRESRCNIQITFCWRKQTRDTRRLSEASWRVTVIAGCAPSTGDSVHRVQVTVCTEYRWHETVCTEYRWHEMCALLGYYAAQNGSSLPTFRHNLSVPNSRVKQSKRTLTAWPCVPSPLKNCLTLPTISTKVLLDPAYHPH